MVRLPKIQEPLNADQYSTYLGQAAKNSGTPLPGGYSDLGNGIYRFQDNTNTDWFKEVFKTGTRQNHNINLSGGGAHNTYNVSLDYFKQKGTLEGAGPNYERFSARVNNTMLFILTQIRMVWVFPTLLSMYRVCMVM